MMYICKIRSAPPSSPPSPPSAPVATPARACPTGSAPPVSMKTMTRIIKTKTITRGMKVIRRRMLTLLRWLTMPAPMESPKTLIAVRNLKEKLMFGNHFTKLKFHIHKSLLMMNH